MDFTNVDMNALAKQLRKPEGTAGKEVGTMMAKNTWPLNLFALDQLHIEPADHILEIGFGSGTAIEEALIRAPQGFVAGIDFSDVMLKMAEERNHRAIMEEQTELTLGSAHSLPYKDESFDKLFAVNVFHFWPDPSRELAECKRVLKKGGRILFFLTQPSSWPKGLDESGVFVAREPEEVETILHDAGFRDVMMHLFAFEDGKGFAVTGIK